MAEVSPGSDKTCCPLVLQGNWARFSNFFANGPFSELNSKIFASNRTRPNAHVEYVADALQMKLTSHQGDELIDLLRHPSAMSNDLVQL